MIQPDAEVPKWLKGLPWKGSRSLVAARGFKSLLLRSTENEVKKLRKKLKKVVDKRKKLCYSKRAVASTTTKNLENWTVCKTLKILIKWPLVIGHEWEHSEQNLKTPVERFKTSQAKFWTGINLNMRVWSWLRMNAGGVPNTCKSNEAIEMKFSDEFEIDWVADGWVTRG